MPAITRGFLLLCSVLSVTAIAAPSARLNAYSHYFGRSPGSALRMVTPNIPIAPTWKQVGFTFYENTGTSAAPVWQVKMRDTVMFDGAGNQVLHLVSTAISGWTKDSLYYRDSTVYSGGKLAEDIIQVFSNGTVAQGQKAVYSYQNNQKTIVTLYSSWSWFAGTWSLAAKDSITLSEPFNGPIWGEDLTSLTGYYTWYLDVLTSKWTNSGHLTRLDAECTTTKQVLSGMQSSRTGNTLVDSKVSSTFIAQPWKKSNLTEYLLQVKPVTAGSFINDSMASITYNASGHQTSYKTYLWDAPGSKWTGSEGGYSHPDSHGFDTLSFGLVYNGSTTVWDTMQRNRSTLTYDANGNPTEAIFFAYSLFNEIWEPLNKITYYYAQINAPVKRRDLAARSNAILVVPTRNGVTLSAHGITEVALYSFSGRVIASLKQQPADALFLRSNGPAGSIPPGSYLAKVTTTSGPRMIRLSICR